MRKMSDSSDDEIYFDIKNVLRFANSIGRGSDVQKELKTCGLERLSCATHNELSRSRVDKILEGALLRKTTEDSVLEKMPGSGKWTYVMEYDVEEREPSEKLKMEHDVGDLSGKLKLETEEKVTNLGQSSQTTTSKTCRDDHLEAWMNVLLRRPDEGANQLEGHPLDEREPHLVESSSDDTDSSPGTSPKIHPRNDSPIRGQSDITPRKRRCMSHRADKPGTGQSRDTNAESNTLGAASTSSRPKSDKGHIIIIDSSSDEMDCDKNTIKARNNDKNTAESAKETNTSSKTNRKRRLSPIPPPPPPPPPPHPHHNSLSGSGYGTHRTPNVVYPLRRLETELNSSEKSRAEVTLHGYLKSQEKAEVYAMQFGLLDNSLIVFCPIPPMTLRTWFRQNLYSYPPSIWRARVESKLESAKSHLLDLLPMPGIDTSLKTDIGHAYKDSLVHFSIVLAATFYNVQVDTFGGETPIMGFKQREMFDFLLTFAYFCATKPDEFGELGEIDVHDIKVYRRQYLSLAFSEYSQFAAVNMAQSGLNIDDELDRRKFHESQGRFNFKFRGNSFVNWKSLTAYGKGRFLYVPTPIRKISHAIVSQGFRTMPDQTKPPVEEIETDLPALGYRFLSVPRDKITVYS